MKYCDFIKSAPKSIFAKWERHRRGTADFSYMEMIADRRHVRLE